MPDIWVREALYLIGLSPATTAGSLKVREWFQLDWQLADAVHVEKTDKTAAPVNLIALRDHINTLILTWAAIEKTTLQLVLHELSLSLAQVPQFAELNTSFFALTSQETTQNKFLLAVYLIIFHESIEALIVSRDISISLRDLIPAFDAIMAQPFVIDEHSQVWWPLLCKATLGFVQPAARAALKSAVTLSLAEVEQSLDTLLSEGNSDAAIALMKQTLNLVIGAIAVAGDTKSAALSQALMRSLSSENTCFGGELSLDFSVLAEQWVMLGMHVGYWLTETGQQYDNPINEKNIAPEFTSPQ